MNYLQLCQRVGREAGTIQGGLPVTVSGATGIELKITQWVNDAWRDIQNRAGAWRWMLGEYQGSVVPGQIRHEPSDFGITRFGQWIPGETCDGAHSLYDPALGTSDDRPLAFIEWDCFYEREIKRERDAGRPVAYSISPADEFCVTPKPDKAYVVRGPYRKGVQTLTADDDVPELPERFHDLIADMALVYLATHDESGGQLGVWQMRAQQKMAQLMRDQLPMVRLAGPLA